MTSTEATTQLPDYRLPVADVIARHATSAEGLDSQRADQLLVEHGPNALDLIRAEPMWHRYLAQFSDWMILLLLASAAVSAYLGDLHTAIVLVILVFFNTAIGFAQEYRAERTMEALQRLVRPMAQVFRDRQLTEIPSAGLVVGDVVRLAEGDLVPADVRLIELSAFATNDFALTGESDPTRKFIHPIDAEVPMANRHNLAYMGTTVATGEACGVVVATGMRTELGRIADLSQSTPRDISPLQREIRHIATIVTYSVIALAAMLLGIALASHLGFQKALLFAVGFASALVPQGLPAEVNTSLAQAAGKLAKANALVKRLSAVETLGATRVICTDKTGTLTRNEMTVVGAVIEGVEYELSGTGYAPEGSVLRAGSPVAGAEAARVRAFLRIGLLASNARVLPPDDHSPSWYCLGDPTEGALVVAATKAGVASEPVPKELRELSFDSGRKRMTSVRALESATVACVKGAPESVLARCARIRSEGSIRPITEADRAAFLAENTGRAEQALRNLAFATRELTGRQAEQLSPDDLEADLVLEGLVSMRDPLREAVPAAMAAAAQAKIAVNVVTGDFAPTALAIARQAGVAGDGELRVVTAEELARSSDQVIRELALRGGAVFSRVSPEDKMRIGGLAQDGGAVVAVTGDGINDAPALKRADIGVAMGLTGTEVAKQASEVVLLDDSFATLVEAIRQGRTIFVNITKGVQSCFTSNAAELVTNMGSLAMATLLGFPLALNVLQILAIDLLAELFPIAALGWDREEGETMKRAPRDPKAHILNRVSIPDIAWCGLLIGGFALANYVLCFDRLGIAPAAADAVTVARATTVTYLTIVTCQLLNIAQRRSVHGLFCRYQFSNRWFWGSVCLSIGIMVSICYLPVVSEFFSSGPIGPIDWLYVLGAGALFVAVRELQRVLHLRWAPGPWVATAS